MSKPVRVVTLRLGDYTLPVKAYGDDKECFNFYVINGRWYGTFVGGMVAVEDGDRILGDKFIVEGWDN